MTIHEQACVESQAEYHAREAERLLKSWWLSSHVQAQVHAMLAVYYATRRGQAEGASDDGRPL